MRKGKQIACGAAALLIAGGAGWFWLSHVHVGSHFYSKTADYLDVRSISTEEYETLKQLLPECDLIWDVPLADGSRFPMSSRSIRVAHLTDADAQQLDYLTNLETVEAEDCTDYGALLALRRRRPEVRILCRVELSGVSCGTEDREVTIPDADAAELGEKLALLPELAEVTLTGKLPEAAELLTLRETYPEKNFVWKVQVGGAMIQNDTVGSQLSGSPRVTGAELLEQLAYLPELTWLDVRACGLTNEEVMALADRYPDCFFLADLTLRDQTFPTDTEEMDISGMQLNGVEEIESLLPYFPKLQRVVMCGCGIDDESMDALNRRHEDVRFVWTVRIKGYDIRTDTKYFYPFKLKTDLVVDNDDIYPLRYCTDIEAIDIGHMTLVENCEWAAFMPNLKYLVIIETRITDLTPLSNLKNLVFLEIFTTNITDYSPLLGCTALEDLNLGKTYGDPTPITQMTWLKNVWWGGVVGTVGLPCSGIYDLLPAALPNTRFKFFMDSPNVENGWRQLDNYYRMRDTMEVFYLA